jgi:glutamate dehydrogenase (NADP+)
MGCTTEAVNSFIQAKIPLAPGKAANAGGVAVSGLEMSQNAMKLRWTDEEVDTRLKDIMKDIHSSCLNDGREGSYINYVSGANKAGFRKVAEAMLDMGF